MKSTGCSIENCDASGWKCSRRKIVILHDLTPESKKHLTMFNAWCNRACETPFIVVQDEKPTVGLFTNRQSMNPRSTKYIFPLRAEKTVENDLLKCN